MEYSEQILAQMRSAFESRDRAAIEQAIYYAMTYKIPINLKATYKCIFHDQYNSDSPNRFAKSDLVLMECGHYRCRNCWKNYVDEEYSKNLDQASFKCT
jgi:hypothetical protein